MSTATDMRDQYIAAEAAILRGARYKWGDRELTRADLAQVQSGRREWERKANAEARTAAGQSGSVGVQLANLTGMPQVVEGGEFGYPWFRG